jgi:acyl-CoA dehydrogenase
MDFEDTKEEAAFRTKVRKWIDANAPKHLENELKSASFGSNGVVSEDPIKAGKAWQKKKAEAGWACLHWPKEYGGAARTPIERVIWSQEEGPYAALTGVFTIGHGMCGPTVMAWASEEHKRELLPPLASGEHVWCQLFSEPASGSDLAGLRTRAVKADDGSGDWIINGQKIWTSGAQYSDWGLLITPHRSRRAEAQGPDDVLPADGLAGRGSPPHQAGERPVELQRSLLHGCPHPRQPAPR